MLRKLSCLFVLTLALLAGAFWTTAFVAESPRPHPAAAVDSAQGQARALLRRDRREQIVALGAVAPFAFVAAIMALMRARLALAACLGVAAYAVGSFLLVTKTEGAIFKPDPIVTAAYCAAWAVPLLVGGVTSWLARRASA